MEAHYADREWHEALGHGHRFHPHHGPVMEGVGLPGDYYDRQGHGHGHGHRHRHHRDEGARRDRLERQHLIEMIAQREAEDARRRHRDDRAWHEYPGRRGGVDDGRRHHGHREERVMREEHDRQRARQHRQHRQRDLDSREHRHRQREQEMAAREQHRGQPQPKMLIRVRCLQKTQIALRDHERRHQHHRHREQELPARDREQRRGKPPSELVVVVGGL